MVRGFLLACAGALIWCGGATAAPWANTDQKIQSSDGIQLATTLYEPVGAPPVGGWPAIIMFHGLGGTRASMNALAEQWTTTAQNAANLLYLTGVPDGSSLTIKTLRVTLPVLKNPVSR